MSVTGVRLRPWSRRAPGGVVRRLVGGLAVAGVVVSTVVAAALPAQSAEVGFWASSVVPANRSASDTAAVEVGMKFRSAVEGRVVGVEFYKGASNTGTHVGSLWSSSGTRLASATFRSETASGWQSVRFAQPVTIAANTTYVVSYFAPKGGYAFAHDGFAASVTVGSLTAPGGSNGVYRYGSSSAFPSSSYKSSNYWVDVIFEPTAASTPTPSPTATTGPAPTPTPPANRPPIADAGADASVTVGTLVTLDGSASRDPDGSALTYAWRQNGGPAVTLAGTTSARPTFTPTSPGQYAFELVVGDGRATSPADTVTVTVTAAPTCPTGQTGTPPDCVTAPPVPASAGRTWQLAFREEFSGTDYDHTRLTPCFDWNYGSCTGSFNQGREWYRPSQVRVSGGTAKLVAEPISPAVASQGCLGGRCTYASGLLATSRPLASNGSDYLFAFRYGYVEARLKLPPATPGFFTAFWMLPADPSYSYATEIDILEVLGNDPSTMWMHYHYGDRGSSYTPNRGLRNNGACEVRDYTRDFVRFGLDWQPTRIAWYIDGSLCGEFTNAASIESGPMQIILNLMIDHAWERSWNVGLADPTLTRQLEVDYLRVFQQR